MTKNAREPNDLDQAIARCLKSYRVSRGWSQTALAERIGVTFQQLQKYENSRNRIAVSRLLLWAAILDIGLPEFFECVQAEALAPEPGEEEEPKI